MPRKQRNVLTLSVIATESARLELMVQFAWQAAAVLDRVPTTRPLLDAFAAGIREVAAHRQPEARLETGTIEEGRLELVALEYGRTRKAAIGIYLARVDERRGTLEWPTEFRLQLPTEHGLLGEFGADLAQLMAADSGTATLRLLPRWPPG